VAPRIVPLRGVHRSPAAACIYTGLPLLTQNRRDFADFAEHEGLVRL